MKKKKRNKKIEWLDLLLHTSNPIHLEHLKRHGAGTGSHKSKKDYDRKNKDYKEDY
jgi:hypothetical protein